MVIYILSTDTDSFLYFKCYFMSAAFSFIGANLARGIPIRCRFLLVCMEAPLRCGSFVSVGAPEVKSRHSIECNFVSEVASEP